ncbi:SMC-Scp complex subunit ScpB [candidate division KSB1 bacterium]
MDKALKKIVESIIFASDVPLSINKIMDISGIRIKKDAEDIIELLMKEYEEMDRSFHLVKIAGGYQFVTKDEFSKWIQLLFKGRRKGRLSTAALETLAIVAYKEPVTRVDIDRIRGVDSVGVLQSLLERELIAISGRSKTPGRPLIYKTTDELVRYLGLESLEDLPKMEEIITKEQEDETDKVEQISIGSGDSFEKEE